MYFTSLIRILKRVLSSLYSIVFIIPYLLVFMITVPISKIHTKFDTESDIQNNKSIDMKDVSEKLFSNVSSFFMDNSEIILMVVACTLSLIGFANSIIGICIFSSNCIVKFIRNVLLNWLSKCFFRAHSDEPSASNDNQHSNEPPVSNDNQQIVFRLDSGLHLDVHALQQSEEEL